ncbi:MAG TPA: hypothetical protein VFF74_10840 [Methylophilaceae bacterium]|nr:hypothetical protein [Methylophilaceae bacterium]
MDTRLLLSTSCLLASVGLLAGCDYKNASDEPGGDNPRMWSSPLNNPEVPKKDEDYDGKKDPPEPVPNPNQT